MSDAVAEQVTTITEHEAEQVARANASGLAPVVFVHGLWLLPSSWDRWAAMFEEAGFTALTPGLARRSRDRRGGQRAPRGVREQDRRPGGRPLRRDHPRAGPQAGRRSATPSAGCSRRSSPGAGLPPATVADRPGAVPRRAAAAALGAEVGAPGPGQPRQPQPRRAADLGAVPLRLRQRRQRGGGQASSTRRSRCRLPGAPLFQAATANLNPWTEAKVDTQEPRPRAAADHLRREGQHGPVGDRERVLQAPEAQRRRDRDRRDPEPRPRAHDRQRLARGRRHGARLRAAVPGGLGRPGRQGTPRSTSSSTSTTRGSNWRPAPLSSSASAAGSSSARRYGRSVVIAS